MAKLAKFTPVKTANGWRINIPAKFSDTGKRRQFHYPTREKALTAAARLKKEHEIFGTQVTGASPSLVEAAVAAAKLLEPLDVGLLDAVRQFVERENFHRASVTIEKVIEEFRASRDCGERQTKNYRLCGEKLIAEFAGLTISRITGEELSEHICMNTGGPGSHNQAVRLVRTIWRWAAKAPRNWCDGEAIEHLEMQDSASGEIGVLDCRQSLAVMRAAERYFPETVPAFAIALFTGIRQIEIRRLHPENITKDGITINLQTSKTKRRRFVEMPKPLELWLRQYPVSEFVTPPDWTRKERAVRRLAGYRIWSDLVPKVRHTPVLECTPPENLPSWPVNALRHTAATVAVALDKPIEKLIFEHGHTGGLEMLRRHYVGALEKTEARKIWAIRPSALKKPKPEAEE